MNLDTILFDIDGTLTDSNDIHAEAWQEAFRHFGKEIAYPVVRSQIGKGGDLLVPDLLGAREMRRFGVQVQEYRGRLFKEKYMARVRPYPFAHELLEWLAQRGVKVALASSANPEEVEYYTRLLGVESIVAARTSKEDAEFSKPSPEIFSAALAQADADPERTLVVGDTPYDVLAAHRISLPVVAVLSGGFERTLLEKAEFVFRDASEIRERIDDIDAWFDE